LSTLPILLAVAFVASAGLTGLMRRYALSHRLVDRPGRRSSHDAPTPRGGGLAIATTVLAGLCVLRWSGMLGTDLFAALLGGGLLVAGVGLWDDHRDLAPRWRLVAHFLAAAWGLFWLGGMPALTLGDLGLDCGLGGDLLALIGLVWAINLYNFMDGIDALAAAEAVFASLAAAGLLALSGDNPAAGVCCLVGVSSLGFLLWNRPPASIFMGDVGSGFLGFVFGVLALATMRVRPLNAPRATLWMWLVLLAVFVADATATLLRRALAGQRLAIAHRTHAYQHLASRWGHLRTTVAISALNVLVLAPLAVLAWRWPAASWAVGLAALAGLGTGAMALGAGRQRSGSEQP